MAPEKCLAMADSWSEARQRPLTGVVGGFASERLGHGL